MLNSFLKSRVGNYTTEELKKFSFLGFIFIFTIAVYWFLRTGKDGIFNTIVGFEMQPIAKFASMFFMFPLTIFYGFLVDKFPKHRVFYALAAIYSVGSCIFAVLLSHETLGITNTIADNWRLVGWAYYLFVESFGSIMVVLFWTYAADITSPEAGKRWFPFLSFMAQFGQLIGSAVNAGYFGTYMIKSKLLICSIAILGIAFMMYIFKTIIPEDQLRSYNDGVKETKKAKVSQWESLKLIVSQPYLLGVFLSITIFEVINTLFDFKFKGLVADNIALQGFTGIAAGEMKTQMMDEWVGKMGVYAAILAIVTYLLGLGNIGRKVGLTASLITLPIILIAISLMIGISHSLWIAFAANVVAKGINYVLYQPSKEQLYIPVSKDAKYKSKALIDTIGSRFSKSLGSGVNLIKAYSPAIFPFISLFSCLGLCGIWIMISIYLGKKYNEAVAKNSVVC
jgi:AAA family ATP:ADP antiporter